MRKIVVTGANKGIGRALVSAILDQAADTFVFLGSRDPKRGEEARAKVVDGHDGWGDRVQVLAIDVTDDASVQGAADQAKASLAGDELYGLVNNAGVGLGSGDMAHVLDVNARGILRVSDAFVPLVQDGGRVVNVTSAAGPSFIAKCSPERQKQLTDPEVSRDTVAATIAEAIELATNDGDFDAAGLGDGDAYGVSKACANAYTLVFAREHPELRVNACTPGFIETDLTRPFLEKSGKSADDVGMKSPDEGTRAPMFLLFGDPPGTGRYYGSDAERSPLDRYRSPGDPPYEGS